MSQSRGPAAPGHLGYNDRGSLVGVQYKHREDKQARRNERPLSAFVRREGTQKEVEWELTDRKRQREAGNSSLDHMTESIVILREKGLERSISPSGGTDKKKQTQRWRDRERHSKGANRQNERKY